MHSGMSLVRPLVSGTSAHGYPAGASTFAEDIFGNSREAAEAVALGAKLIGRRALGTEGSQGREAQCRLGQGRMNQMALLRQSLHRLNPAVILIRDKHELSGLTESPETHEVAEYRKYRVSSG